MKKNEPPSGQKLSMKEHLFGLCKALSGIIYFLFNFLIKRIAFKNVKQFITKKLEKKIVSLNFEKNLWSF
jgi:hypothetical protein